MENSQTTAVAVSNNDQLSSSKLPIAGSFDYEKQIALLSPAEKEKYLQIASSIKYDDIASVHNYGSELSSVISSNGEELLKAVRADNSAPVVEMTNELLAQLNLIDIDQLNDSTWKRMCRKLPILRKFSYKIKNLLQEYDTVAANVQKISDKIATAKLTAMRDNNMLDQIFKNNIAYIEKIRELTIAAKLKMAEIDADLERMQADPTVESWDIESVRNLKNELDKRIVDMETYESIFTQNIYQIRMTQKNNIDIADKSDSIVTHLIPLWKGQLTMAVIMNNQRASIEAERKISDATNQMLRKNSEILKINCIEAAKENERQLVDIETLQTTTKNLVETIYEVQKIHEEGAKNRREIENKLRDFSEQLQHRALERGAE
ncbi:MAG: tellurite resistance [Wendovervirus sonii]|uniref:Tellurite resistance n=1 Tax=phage Lak_Megaphage_Sonny TaxID=3109229 RepID=A0ABZ0Z6H3_9CAUD|nr:MAG: tellurite resistance [phage Lak_Megaphage_Sonny]